MSRNERDDGADVTELARRVRAGEVGPRELVEDALARIGERNPTINAVTEVRAEAALVEADAGPTGPLGGVPFVIKDLGMDVAGMHSTGGSRVRAGVVATVDSTLVERYRRAGLIVVGMTNAAEFGRSPSTEPLLFGPTRNPHKLTHSAGGSSGGTAAAVAAGIVPAGHGNDGGGSIRIPASMCGLVGLKPTRGRTPAHPRLVAFAYPTGINHALTHTVRDSALLLDIGAGPTPGDAWTIAPPERPFVAEVGAPPGRLRIALCTETPSGTPVDPEAVAATEAAGTLLESLGHEVVRATPPWPLDDLQHAMRVVMSVPMVAEIDNRLAELGRGLRDGDLEPFTHVIYDIGKAVTGVELVAALHAVERAGLALGPFFTAHDLLLTPTMPVRPPAIGVLDTTDVASMYREAGPLAAFTSVFNVSGQPAISLPLARYVGGLPLGIQLVAASGREDFLLRVAAQVEAAAPWSTAPVWPPVP